MHRTLLHILRVSVILASLFYRPGFLVAQTFPYAPTVRSESGYRYLPENSLPFSVPAPGGGLMLKSPSNVSWNIEFRPGSNDYMVRRSIGDSLDYRVPFFLNQPEYLRYMSEQNKKTGWWDAQRRYSLNRVGSGGATSQLTIDSELFDRVFGTNVITITPQGSAELTLGVTTNKVDNPILNQRARKTTTFDFDTKLQMSVTGAIGDKMKLGITYDTEATFDFENEIKLGYEGKEDEILRKIEVGNVSLGLPGSLITGSQSLFGFKAELQFGKLAVTTLFSQQKGETSVVSVKGGAQVNEFEIEADSYDANKHFFLAQYFRDHYERSLATLPVVTSDITITRLEAWVTNRSNNFENARNVVAFTDLAESNHIYNAQFSVGGGAEQIPQNDTTGVFNRLYGMLQAEVRDIDGVSAALSDRGLAAGVDYEKLQNARLLSPAEYSFHPRLGYISLNAPLNNDEVLSVAYEYIYRGRTYRVGDLTGQGVDGSRTLMTKLLKNTNLSPRLPLWTLMMKNIYLLSSFQLSPDDFQLQVLYRDDKSGNEVSYIPEDQTSADLLLRVVQLDRMNTQSDPYPDGRYDWMEGITIVADRGRVIFPVLEPFGSTLKKYLEGKNVLPGKVDGYVFQELYDSTLTQARQMAEKNKFLLRGTYRSSAGSEIMLNAYNVPQGSVVVTAGGQKLAENLDYTVDYASGKVRILNQGILESGTEIRVSLEDNARFNMQTKTLMGTHLNYQFNENFNVGATLLNLTERPLTQKVNIGDEPISNTIWGLNVNYSSEADWLTRMVDRLPLIQTTAPSRITFEGEFAQLLPGSSRSLQHAGEAYIDDFEGGESSYDMKAFTSWTLSSVPSALFPESRISNSLVSGMNRARLAWYSIDPLFNSKSHFSSATPANIRNDAQSRSSHFVNMVYETDIFKNKEHKVGEPTYLSVLNVAFYPREKGPYNFDTDGANGYSYGVNSDGSLKRPENRWGGMMRAISNSDFEAVNIGFIEFWLMDPFVEDTEGRMRGGDLYFDLGNISEDILKDGRKAYENGLPIGEDLSGVDSTAWGLVPRMPSLVNAFDDQLPGARTWQDVGLDGLNDTREGTFYSAYVQRISQLVTSQGALHQILADPSTDDFRYPRGDEWDLADAGILQRYKYFNGVEGNSSKSEFSNTGLPTVEDINLDNTLSENESYYQYRVSLRPEDLVQVGQNFITDVVSNTVNFPNGQESTVNWYQFRIPIDEFERSVGAIQDFKSIRFMRMFLTGFQDSVIMRFATLDLVRSEWRKYDRSFRTPGEGLSTPESLQTSFELASVNIEENAGKDPVPYVLPPGFDRAVDQTSRELQQLNEQSLLLRVKNLTNGDARAVYKNVVYDMREYKRLKMEVHAEQLRGTSLTDDELTVFIRVGSDYRNNYYEYEVPLKLTPWGATNPYEVWPAENSVDIDLDQFVAVKEARNAVMNQSGSNVNYTTVFAHMIDGKQYYVCGNPNLGNIRTVMIGVRYPVRANAAGEVRSAEVWFNELRLSDVDNEGGWAAQGRLVTRLADFATVSLSGSVATVGFGSLDSKVSSRNKEETKQYDVASNVELGKFFPEKSGVQIPVYASYGESFVSPKYNPLDPDVLFQDALGNASSARVRDSIKNMGQDYTRRRSFNFTNVRIVPQNSRKRFYSLSNFTLNYSYYETFRRDVRTEKNLEKRYSGSIQYDYSASPQPVLPFSRVPWFSGNIWRLFREFNFNYLPSRVSFGTAMTRNYREISLRDLNASSAGMAPTVDKNFIWTRHYHVAYDLTRALKIDFTANGIARIDEPEGIVNRHMKDSYQVWRDSVWRNIRDFGRLTQYYHDVVASYSLPVNKIPYLDWMSSMVSYTGSYNWDVAPVMPAMDGYLFQPGNTIKNSRNVSVTGTFMFSTLYDKFSLIKKLRGDRETTAKRTREVSYKRENMSFRAGLRKVVSHNLKTRDVQVKAFDADGKAVAIQPEILSDTRVGITVDEDVQRVTVEVTGRVEVSAPVGTMLTQGISRFLTGIRNISIMYSGSGGTLVPGYLPQANILGMSGNAPGFPFLLGWQDESFPDRAAERNWLSKDSTLNSPVVFTSNNTVNIRAMVEPIKGVEIEFSAVRSSSENKSLYYIYDGYSYPEVLRNPIKSGNFSMSVVALTTAFEKMDPGNKYLSKAFENFKEYRSVISGRRAQELGRVDGAYNPAEGAEEAANNGYGLNAQDVVLPAFLAAYTGKSAQKVTLKTIPGLLQMMPNWIVRFTGLRDMDFVKRNFRNLSLNHSYRAIYTMGSYAGNPDFSDVREAAVMARDRQNNFIPELNVTSVSINEQFSPLLGIDMMFLNNVSFRFEVRKSRMVTLSMANIQITETMNNEYVFGTGYTFNEIPLVLRSLAGNAGTANSRLMLRGDLSIRDSKAFLRRLDQDAQPSQGQRVVTLKLSSEYTLNNSITLSMFYDRIVNQPFISTSYKTTNATFGFTLRFSMFNM